MPELLLISCRMEMFMAMYLVTTKQFSCLMEFIIMWLLPALDYFMTLPYFPNLFFFFLANSLMNSTWSACYAAVYWFTHNYTSHLIPSVEINCSYLWCQHRPYSRPFFSCFYQYIPNIHSIKICHTSKLGLPTANYLKILCTLKHDILLSYEPYKTDAN